jgi:hypothetical protein
VSFWPATAARYGLSARAHPLGSTTSFGLWAEALESHLVLALADVAPILVFLDDVHVADASFWDVLHYLARNLAGAPVLVLAAARAAELAGQAVPIQVLLGLEQDGLLRRLGLRPMPTEAVGELAGAVLGHAPPPALVTWLDGRCLGNPSSPSGSSRRFGTRGPTSPTPGCAPAPGVLGRSGHRPPRRPGTRPLVRRSSSWRWWDAGSSSATSSP